MRHAHDMKRAPVRFSLSGRSGGRRSNKQTERSCVLRGCLDGLCRRCALRCAALVCVSGNDEPRAPASKTPVGCDKSQPGWLLKASKHSQPCLDSISIGGRSEHAIARERGKSICLLLFLVIHLLLASLAPTFGFALRRFYENARKSQTSLEDWFNFVYKSCRPA